ncbi:hypothetical protein BSKO_04819 [Bryopsis sp. KO-2023]|nr:hypothetical protein BSKO_04819 [Bryopsis sp. KO-2023]
MRKRVIFELEGSGRTKPAVMNDGCTLVDLIAAAGNKLKVKPKRLLLDGTPLTEESITELEAGSKLVVCTHGHDCRLWLNSVCKGSNAETMPEISKSQPSASEPLDGQNRNSHSDPGAQDEGVRNRPLGNGEVDVTILAKKSCLESEAIDQLKRTLIDFPSMRVAAGMPDLHPGPQFPIGAAFASEGEVMPFLVGSDVGCGMTLFPTSLKDRGPKKAQKWVSMLESMDGPWNGDVRPLLEEGNVRETSFDKDCLGTVGGGNHFAELQSVESVEDDDEFEKLGMNESKMYLLVHSGSRAYGAHILKQHLDSHGVKPLVEGSPEFDRYMEKHDNACAWAGCNRRLIAFRFLTALGVDTSVVGNPVLDICHNNVVKMTSLLEDGRALWLHRKGAAPADCGPVVIPGSRGAFSYLVLPTQNPSAQRCAAYSLAHGAGRRWARGKALAVGQTKYPNPKALTTTPLGSHVVCDDATLLYQEQPDAYKEIDEVIEDLENAGLISVVAVLRPVITYKTKSPDRQGGSQKWKDDRKRASLIVPESGKV